MSTVISVDGLAKRYRIRHEVPRYRSLREEMMTAVADMLSNPFDRKKDHGAVTHEDFWALRDVSFEVKQGDRLGVIGRNGAGKSTLLKILSRITDPTAGRVEIAGRLSSLLEVGTGFHPELTGRENIFLNGAILGMRSNEVRRKFDQIVDFAEVERFLDTPVKRYSSGMYVRLAFAVAAHLEPEILIVDEVLAVGDAPFQKKCLSKMSDISTEGRTIIFVSHNMGAVQSLTSRCLWINGGRVMSIGSTDTVVAEYFSTQQNNFIVDTIQSSIEGLSIDRFSMDESSLVDHGEIVVNFDVVNKDRAPVNEFSAGLQIVNSIGCRIGTARATIKAMPGMRERYRLSIRDHRLPPGNYSLNFGMDIDGVGAIYKERIISLEVPDLNMYGSFVSARRDILGVVFKTELSSDRQDLV